MSNPTPALGDTAGWQAFTTSVVALVGDRDPLAVLAELPDALTSAVAGLEDAALRQPEGPGKWSIADVLGHLVDAELVFGFRIRQMLTLAAPALPSFDQDGWAALGTAGEEPIREVLALLVLLRQRNLRLYARLSPEQWQRTGVHADRGAESVRQVVTINAGHDLAHRRQVTRIRQCLPG